MSGIAVDTPRRDGEPARGYGGTADVVEAAEQRGVPVTVIWPDGASRDRTRLRPTAPIPSSAPQG
jgi:hypothetical protein